MYIKYSQNFLKNNLLIERLISKANIDRDDIVLDIGAGKGAIAQTLAKYAKKVIALELDKSLSRILKEKFSNIENIEVIETDFLIYSLPNIPYKVFSNIPFNITADVVNKLLYSDNPPLVCFLVMQNEAAQRYICANENTLLVLILAPIYETSIVHKFSRFDFDPVPAVECVLFRARKRSTPTFTELEYIDYKKLMTYIFKQQKPTLKLRLNKLFTSQQFKHLAQDLNFSETIQASKLSWMQWQGLFNYYLTGVAPEKKI